MIELSEDGFVEVAIVVGETRIEKKLDLYAVHNHLCALFDGSKDKTAEERATSYVEYLESLGYPKCSHRTALRFRMALGDIIADMEKKDSASKKLDSPKFTEPASLGPTPAPSTV